jgi:hypothetical protein
MDRDGWFTLAIYAFFLILTVFMLVTAQSFSWQDKLFPMVVAIPTVALILSKMMFIIKPDLKTKYFSESKSGSKNLQERLSESIEGGSGDGHPPEVRRKYERMLIIWITSLPILMYLFGMLLTVPLFVFAFVWFFDGSIKSAVATTVIFSVLSYIIFIWFLDLSPVSGILI